MSTCSRRAAVRGASSDDRRVEAVRGGGKKAQCWSRRCWRRSCGMSLFSCHEAWTGRLPPRTISPLTGRPHGFSCVGRSRRLRVEMVRQGAGQQGDRIVMRFTRLRSRPPPPEANEDRAKDCPRQSAHRDWGSSTSETVRQAGAVLWEGRPEGSPELTRGFRVKCLPGKREPYNDGPFTV